MACSIVCAPTLKPVDGVPVSTVVELTTKRLLLRQWGDSDREPFAHMNADPRVMEFFPSLMTRQESNAFADRCQSLLLQRGWGLWAVERWDNGEFIGFVGLHVPTHDLPFNPCVEIGWRLAFAHWGQGFATEAAHSALALGFQRLELEEIVSFTSLKNLRSRAVMERLGMRDAQAPFDHPAVAQESGLRRHCLYRLSRQDWLAAQ